MLAPCWVHLAVNDIMNVAFTGNYNEEDSDVTLSDSEYKFKAKIH